MPTRARLLEAIARRPNARQTFSVCYLSPSKPAGWPVSPRNAHGARASPNRHSDDCWKRRPGARPNAHQTFPVHCVSQSAPAARPVSPRNAHGARTKWGIPPVRLQRPAPGPQTDVSCTRITPFCGEGDARRPPHGRHGPKNRHP